MNQLEKAFQQIEQTVRGTDDHFLFQPTFTDSTTSSYLLKPLSFKMENIQVEITKEKFGFDNPPERFESTLGRVYDVAVYKTEIAGSSEALKSLFPSKSGSIGLSISYNTVTYKEASQHILEESPEERSRIRANAKKVFEEIHQKIEQYNRTILMHNSEVEKHVRATIEAERAKRRKSKDALNDLKF